MSTEQPYKEFTFPGGYVYRQFRGGDILIVASPDGNIGVKTKRIGATSKAWKVANAKIQAKKIEDNDVPKTMETSLLPKRFGKKDKKAKSDKYREWAFAPEPPDKTGYTYRQFKNGDILIVRSPHGGAGTKVTKGGAQSKAWAAIDAQIRAKKAGNRQAIAMATLNVTRTLLVTLTPRQRQSQQMPEFAPSETETESESKPGLPWLPIGVGAAAIALIVVVSRSN